MCRLKSIRKGAKTMVVPIPMTERQRTRFGIQWILKAADKRAATQFEKRVAMEMLAVLDGSSNVLKMLDERHKVAMMNRCGRRLLSCRPRARSPTALCCDRVLTPLCVRSLQLQPAEEHRRLGKTGGEGSACALDAIPFFPTRTVRCAESERTPWRAAQFLAQADPRHSSSEVVIRSLYEGEVRVDARARRSCRWSL